MKAIFTEEQFASGQVIASKLIGSLADANVPVPNAVVGLMAATVIASNLMGAPLESILEHIRLLNKGYAQAKLAADQAAAGLIVPA